MTNPDYADDLPPITLNLTPHEVGRALDALREGDGMIASSVADRLQAAAPEHVAILDETGWFEDSWRRATGSPAVDEVPEDHMAGPGSCECQMCCPRGIAGVAAVCAAINAMRAELSGVRVDLSNVNRAFRGGPGSGEVSRDQP